MLLLGQKQELVIIKTVEFGVYLAESMDSTQEKVLLPAKQVPKEAGIGDLITVFLYRDSKDRLIATVHEPVMMLHQIGKCRVAAVSKVGAFLEWGLEKDLLLPFREQTYPVEPGEEILAALYIDKSNRLCATMKLYPYLEKQSGYQKDDTVQGIVYEISAGFGAFVAVDGKYSALIPKKELLGEVKAGQEITARVSGVKEDGKLDLSLRQKAYLQMDADAEKIRRILTEQGGSLPFNDRAAPELIREKMGMSKNEFKRAVGRLYKEKAIRILPDSIQLIQKK
ncbi:MAG: S1 RNA-binding domain-containing protein [Lachnospiraceae bacterium]|jgi:hypothetical protein|nr:S1 RNA-binding domain-containing protein [Lachnospiraceae bacterium]